MSTREPSGRGADTPPDHRRSPSPYRVAIIGGGIAGLSTAYALQQRARRLNIPLTCTLIESRERLGGVILTERVESFVIEAGPDSLLTQKPWGLELCHALGLGDRLIGTNQQQRTVYILWQGRLQPLPAGLSLVVPTRLSPLLRNRLLSWPGKCRLGLEYLLPPRPAAGDESLAAFVRRRLGQEVVDKIAEPLLAGIYSGSAHDLSLLATFPQLRDLEVTHGGLIRGMLARRRAQSQGATTQKSPPSPLFMAPQGGMAEIVKGLSRALDQVAIEVGHTVQRIVPRDTGGAGPQGYVVHYADQATLHTDAVVCATPAHVTATLVEGFHPQLAAALSAIPYVSTATISLAYQRGDVAHPLDGYGFLVGKHEGRHIMAASWTSTKFPYRAPPASVLIRGFIGGPGGEELIGRDDAGLVKLVRQDVEDILGITAAPLLARVYRWERANPQYLVGHLERLEAIDQLLASYPGLYLTGSAYRGVGIPDCIHQGSQTAEHLLASPARLG